jgi:hypothetical protein
MASYFHVAQVHENLVLHTVVTEYTGTFCSIMGLWVRKAALEDYRLLLVANTQRSLRAFLSRSPI